MRHGGAWIGSIREALLDAAAVVLPTMCAGCGAVDRSLCATCREALEPRVRRVPLEGVGGGADDDGPGGDGPPWVVAAADYEGVVRSVLLSFKDADRAFLARRLAPALAAAARAALDRVRAASPDPGGLVWVPVPSRPSSVRRRGYRPVVLLARRAGIPVRGLLVARSGARRSAQKTLGIEARAANVRDQFRVRGDVAGRPVLLLDDVVTTGATLREATRALRDAGADVRGAAVLAQTRRRHPAVADSAAAPGCSGDADAPPSGFIPRRW